MTTYGNRRVRTTIEFTITGEIIVLIVLLILAVAIIAILQALFILLPAIVVAVVIWFLTRNLIWTGLASLAIATLSIIKRH
jgi:hypothetical protein